MEAIVLKKKEWICTLYGRLESILDKSEKGWINLVCGISRLRKWHLIIKWVENYQKKIKNLI